MKTVYNSIEINYVEGTDDWHFELRGRSRTAPSLARAKEAIDKEPVQKRTQTFPRFEAYLLSYQGFKTVTVTSIAEDRYNYNGASFWVQGEGGRKKERDILLFPVNDHNTAIIEQIKATEAERDKLGEKVENLKGGLQKAAVPAEIAA